MSYPLSPSLTLQLGSAQHGTMPDWETIIRIQEEARAKANAEAEISNRRYTMSKHATPGLGYDDRLYVRLGCCSRTAYDLLEAGVIESAKLKSKYVVTEEAVRNHLSKARTLKKVA